MTDLINPELCVPKERVQFGNYQFVKINPYPKVPVFHCCANHDGDSDYCIPYQSKAENAANNMPHKAPPVPATTSTHRPNILSSIENHNRLPNNAMMPKPLPPPQNFHDSFDDEMEIEDVDPDAERRASAFFGFPEDVNPRPASQLSDSIQIVDFVPAPSKPFTSRAPPPRFPPAKEVQILDDDFDDDENFLAAINESKNPPAPRDITPDVETTDVVHEHYYVGMGQRHDQHGKFKTYLKDDGDAFMNSYQVLGATENARMYRTLKNVFGHNDFRLRQKAAIVAILKKVDCFILMPTGAGKSLCYQLPALLSDGVTVVISPLISLIADQIAKLQSLKISACALKSGSDDFNAIFAKLQSDTCDIKLLYITPEMISKSTRFLTAMRFLHENKKLDRIVIDEAHCISQWGHDFRPDYTRLNVFIEQFKDPRVPIVALTASATPTIITDIRAHLAVPNSKLFMSSFVRDNLKYDVQPKTAYSLKKLITELKQKFNNSSGIVYCLSQKDTETLAGMFEREGFTAAAYHAGLPDARRTSVQKDWMAGKISVVCATIAFGMGIDKPNVRFILHHSLPKSIEGYYQETGRAGRDGLPAYCILLYSYQDHIRLRSLQEGGKQVTSKIGLQHRKSIYEMVNYCENVTTCQRKLLVEHFGEIYDAAACQASPAPCSICGDYENISKKYQLYEITEDARQIINDIRAMNSPCISYVTEIYRGILCKKNQEKATRGNHTNLNMYGRGANLSEADATRLMRKLVIEEYLEERLVPSGHGNSYGVLHIADKGNKLTSGDVKSKVYIHLTNEKRKSASSAANVHLKIRSNMIKISESAALKERCLSKHSDIVNRCKKELQQMFNKSAQEKGYPSYTTIICQEGLEQLSALMPRTNSDLLQIESMTRDKVTEYSAQVMGILSKYWTEMDNREHDEIRKQIDQLKRATASNYDASSSSTPNNYSSTPPTPPQTSYKYGKYGKRANTGGGRAAYYKKRKTIK